MSVIIWKGAISTLSPNILRNQDHTFPDTTPLSNSVEGAALCAKPYQLPAFPNCLTILLLSQQHGFITGILLHSWAVYLSGS